MSDDHDFALLRARIVDTYRPLLTSGTPVALVDFPDSMNSGDHAIWLGEKALLSELQIEVAYECSAKSYDKSAMQVAVGSGTILMHGGGNFGDIYPLYQTFRLRVLGDFPNNPVIVFSQTAMFFADETLQTSVAAFAKHRDVTIAARDALSFHVLEKWFGHVARILLAPDIAIMLGPLQRSCDPQFDILCISRMDSEGIYGPALVASSGLKSLKKDRVDLGEFDDRLAVTVNALVGETKLLLSDWYQMRVPDQQAIDAHQRLAFDQRSKVWLSRAIRLLSFGRVVVTDRLHGHILCTLAGIPHVLLNNSYGKNISYFETWSRPSRLCRLAADPPAAWSQAQHLLVHVSTHPTIDPTD